MTTVSLTNFKKRIKKTILSTLAAGLVALIPLSTSAYSPGTIENPKTHPRLTSLSAALYQQSHSESLNLDALIKGSIEEDSPDFQYIRSYNHFQNWENGKGLWGFPSASQWAQGSDLQSGEIPFDNFLNSGLLWTKPLKDFYISILPNAPYYPYGDCSWPSALTNERRNSQESLGHILHLIQDVTVPAHTRMDPHAFLPTFTRNIRNFDLHEDSFETWAGKYFNTELSPRGIVTISSIDEAFSRQASFSGSHFFSDNTVDASRVPDLEERKEGRKTYYYVAIDGQDVPILRKGFLKSYIIDTKVLEAQWQILGARAVEVGAGVIKLYFQSIATSPDCTPHASRICNRNDAYWQDSCGQLEEVIEVCGQSRYCDSGRCVTNPTGEDDGGYYPPEPDAGTSCQPHASRTCQNGDAYFEDSCGNLEERIEDCNNGCSDGICSTPSCTSHSSRTCSNGDVYWRDSCGTREGLAENCGNGCNDGVCNNDTPTCNDECSQGQKECYGNGWRQCGDYNSDGCTEWSSTTACSGTCLEGICQGSSCGLTSGCTDPGCIFYDNFSGDLCRWNVDYGDENYVSIANGNLDLFPPYAQGIIGMHSMSIPSCPGDFSLEFRWKQDNYVSTLVSTSNGPRMNYSQNYGCGGSHVFPDTFSTSDWNTMRLEMSNNIFEVYRNNILIGESENVTCSLTNEFINILCTPSLDSGHCYLDYIKIKCN